MVLNRSNNTDDDQFDENEDEEEVLDRIEKQVGAWCKEFITSAQFQQLSDHHKIEAGTIIQNFADFAYEYEGLKPANWDPAIIEEFCLDYAPRKVTAEKEYFQAIEPVLSAFLLFLQPRGIVADPPRMVKSLRECGPTMIARSQNPANWGFAKSLAMQAIADGKNPSDPGEMQMYAMMHNMNQLQMAQARQRQSSRRPPSPRKVGRHESCPCGSGLKYKKCCGQRVNSYSQR